MLHRFTVSLLFSFSFAGMALAEPSQETAWDVIVEFEGGASAGVMRLTEEDGRLSGTSEPLDENQFFPLSVQGTSSDEIWSLNLSFRGDEVGELTLGPTDDHRIGEGVLYGVPVTVLAHPSDRALRAPQEITYTPTRFEMQYESRSEPVLTLVPGDRVTTTLLDNEGQDADLEYQAMPGNTLTGPFFVEGAMPGDTLVVHLRRVSLNRDTAKMYSHQLNQAAIQPGQAQNPSQDWGRTWRLDAEAGTARIEADGSAIENLTLPLEPMVGSIGVAPPLNMALYSGDLWIHGGNLDYRRMREGVRLYIPVHRAGAYLVLGDGHARQGDGEISGQGLETSLEVEFEIDLIPGERLSYLWSEDDDYVMVHGIDNTMDEALQAATTGMSRWLQAQFGLEDSEIAALLSSAIEYDVAVIVNSRPHIVARLDKSLLEMITPRTSE